MSGNHSLRIVIDDEWIDIRLFKDGLGPPIILKVIKIVNTEKGVVERITIEGVAKFSYERTSGE